MNDPAGQWFAVGKVETVIAWFGLADFARPRERVLYERAFAVGEVGRIWHLVVAAVDRNAQQQIGFALLA
ncbi:hypothetical protein MOKP105_04830 [Mycobacterium avium subsp. hominissuis]